MTSRCAAWLLALATVGCTAGTAEPDAVGFVLLDREARAVGQLAHDTWRGAPLLPVALDVAEPVAFSSPAGRVVFDLRPGALAYVHGAGGTVEWLRVGDDIGADRLRVYASKEVAADLAKRLAGRVEGGADGLFTIVAADVFERASFLEAPGGIAEIAPDRQSSESAARTSSDRATGAGSFVVPSIEKIAVLAPSAPLPEGASEGVRQALLVGVYTREKSALILDADGGFSLEDACSGDAIDQGRYRTEGDHVVLDSASSSRVLVWEGGALLDPNGVQFAPLVAPDVAPLEERGEP